MANRAEEANPWATIIKRAPFHLHEFPVITAARRSPIWPTEA